MTALFVILTFVVTFLLTRKHYKPQTLSAKDLLKDDGCYRIIGRYISEGKKEPLAVYSFQEVDPDSGFKEKGEIFFVSSSKPGFAFNGWSEVKEGLVYEAKANWTKKVILTPKR